MSACGYESHGEEESYAVFNNHYVVQSTPQISNTNVAQTPTKYDISPQAFCLPLPYGRIRDSPRRLSAVRRGFRSKTPLYPCGTPAPRRVSSSPRSLPTRWNRIETSRPPAHKTANIDNTILAIMIMTMIIIINNVNISIFTTAIPSFTIINNTSRIDLTFLQFFSWQRLSLQLRLRGSPVTGIARASTGS